MLSKNRRIYFKEAVLLEWIPNCKIILPKFQSLRSLEFKMDDEEDTSSTGSEKQELEEI